MPLTHDAEIAALLQNAKTIAVVGYSNQPDRASYSITHALIRAGFDVYPVNPTITDDTELKVYASLADVPVPIDIVDIFRRPADVPPVVEEAIAVGAKAIWMQLGITNDQAAARAEAVGLKVVQDKCIKVEYRRLMSAASAQD
jgi:uncharacterized protein